MAGRMEGKVSFITGAGRGQGRAHAVLQAREGADIIAVDICEDIKSNPYPMASWDDLMDTKTLVEEAGRRCVAVKADVRDREAFAESNLTAAEHPICRRGVTVGDSSRT